MPDTTSMMRKRAVPDLAAHLVTAVALAPANLAATLRTAAAMRSSTAASIRLCSGKHRTPRATASVTGREKRPRYAGRSCSGGQK